MWLLLPLVLRAVPQAPCMHVAAIKQLLNLQHVGAAITIRIGLLAHPMYTMYRRRSPLTTRREPNRSKHVFPHNERIHTYHGDNAKKSTNRSMTAESVYVAALSESDRSTPLLLLLLPAFLGETSKEGASEG